MNVNHSRMNVNRSQRDGGLVGMFLGAVLLAGSMVTAAPPATGGSTLKLSIRPDHELKIDWQGRPLVVTDGLKNIGPTALANPEGVRTDQVNGWTVHNIWKTQDPNSAVTYRREAAENGRWIELTVQFRVPAYYAMPPGGSDVYYFDMPLTALEGMTFRASVGPSSGPKEARGRITADMPDGPILKGKYASTRFISFEKDGHGLIFDFNPKGVVTFNEVVSPTSLSGFWRIDKKGNHLEFRFGMSTTAFGGVANGKVRILEGTFSDYDKLHAHRAYRYNGPFPAIRQLAFGAGTPLKGWSAAGTGMYTSSRGYGWKSNDGLRQQGDISKGELHGLVLGHGERSLLIDVPEPGIYIFTVRTASDQAVGPFDLLCDGHPVAIGVTAQAGQVQSLVFSRYTEGRRIALTWRGDWAVGSVALQTLIYKAQDFSFKRNVWLADDVPTPTDLFMFRRYFPRQMTAVDQTPDTTAIQNTPWTVQPPPASVLNNATVPPGEVNIPASGDPALLWRWDGNITSLGPGNGGSFYGIETDAQINRRLDELQKLGYRIILLNGLHVRLAYIEQQPRVTRTIARIVKLAHARGMKVLDHFDLSIVAYLDAGYNLLLEHLDWAQRDVRTGQITRGWCLNNPHFRKYFWTYITNTVRRTGVDGLMIDEAMFYGPEYCGCRYCREKFYKETGVRLPYDGAVLMNPNSRVWKLWLRWRAKSMGDWVVALRRHVQQVQPHLVIMKYTTNLANNWAFLHLGSSLLESARGADVLGEEIMSRNVFASFRSNLANREIYNSLRHAFGSPVFGLVYPGNQPVFAYAGWAQNNMSGQATWSISGNEAIEADARRYLGWKDNMDRRRARSAARVAVVFSAPSRNFHKYYYSYEPSLLGTAELLGDQHVPFQVILNRDLTAEKLKPYGLLVLPGDCCLSDAELTAIKTYLEAGGHVVAMGTTGLQDELGVLRDDWSIGRWIGLRYLGKFLPGPMRFSGELAGANPIAFKEPAMQVVRDPHSAQMPRVLLRLDRPGHVGEPRFIAAAEGPVGKGQLLVIVPRLAAVNCERLGYYRQASKYTYDPVMGDLFARLIDRMRPDHPPFRAIQMPRAVRMTVYRQPSADGDVTTEVHLYNGTGAHAPAGEELPAIPPKTPFPPLEKDLVFDVNLAGSGPPRGDLVSPDFEGSRAVGIEALGERHYRITVNKRDFKAYAIVRLH